MSRPVHKAHCPYCGRPVYPSDDVCVSCGRELLPAAPVTGHAGPPLAAVPADAPQLPPVTPDDADRVLGAAALAPGPTPARTPTENLGRVVLVVVGLVVVASLVGTIASGVGGAARSHPAAPQPASLQPQAAAPASSPAPVVTAPPTVQYQWQEIEERFRQPGLTSMQKDQMTDALQGSWVQMTGEVSDVGTMLASTYIGMRCNSSTLTSDTHVSMSPGQTPELAQLRKGQVITVIAQFLSHGMLGHSYRNGRLVR